MAVTYNMEINLNEEQQGIELKFSAWPGHEVIKELKEHGFRWHNANKLWYARQSPERMDFVNGLVAEEQLEIVEEQVQPEKTEPLEDSITVEEIDLIILRGSNVSQSKMRIYEHFQKNLSTIDNINFLKDEYGMGGSYPAIADRNISEDHSAKGINIVKRNENSSASLTLSWHQVANRIKELIKEDKYLSEKEKEYYPTYLTLKEKQKQRSYISAEFKDIIVEFNEHMQQSGNTEAMLNRYVFFNSTLNL